LEGLEDTYNHLKISEFLAASGQPNERLFHLIKEAGHKAVINLAAKIAIENSLKAESYLLNL